MGDFEPVKSHIALGLVAVAFLVVVLVLWVAPYSPRVYHTTFGLQAGSSICPGLQFLTGSGGSIAVTVNATPGTVTQYVMTEDQFVAFSFGGAPAYLDSRIGSNFSFTTSLPAAGEYELVSCHGPGYGSVTQAGLHRLTVNARDASWGFAAYWAAGVGGLLAVAAVLVWWRNERAPSSRLSRFSWGAPRTAPGPPGTAPTTASEGGAVMYGTLLVTVENRSAIGEAVRLLLDGVPMATVALPPGLRAGLTLHPALSAAAETRVRIEAVTASGMRATQEATVSPVARSSVSLRIG